MKKRVAIIGSGVSGLTAAYCLRDTHEVSLFEADSRFGGHAHTHFLKDEKGKSVNVDSGFIVHNERTYPNLLRIFRELGIATKTTEMSMSISCGECGLQYAGGRGLKGIAAQPLRLLNPKFITMLIAVPRFFKQAREVLASDKYNELTWGEFLEQNKFSPYFIKHFAIPLVSCVWSAGDEDSLDYPAKHLFAFLGHHGMLTLGNSPTWRTVVGGSQMYVSAIIEKLSSAHVNAEVTSVKRFDDHVEVTTTAGLQSFDYAILATHANTSLDLLVDADQQERDSLSNIKYSTNQTWLHNDDSVLPLASGARASWNYKIDSCSQETQKVLVSYWMNKLMLLDTETPYLVTLNGQDAVNKNRVIAKMNYEHPIFTLEAVKAAAFLRTAGGPRLAFAGAHLGWGFHEDGARSGVEAAKKFGSKW